MLPRNWLLLPGIAALAACASIPQPVALSPAQREAVETAQAYLNGIPVFEARFSQSGWAGTGAGTLWVDRPGRLRLTYFGPNAKDMVANDGLLVVQDHATGAVTTTPVAKTPLGLLLAPRITLTGGVGITNIDDQQDALRLTLQDEAHPEQGTLAVVLAKNPLRLTEVTATDIRGRSLTLALSDLTTSPVITPELFRLPAGA